jgi:hypothetical protein
MTEHNNTPTLLDDEIPQKNFWGLLSEQLLGILIGFTLATLVFSFVFFQVWKELKERRSLVKPPLAIRLDLIINEQEKLFVQSKLDLTKAGIDEARNQIQKFAKTLETELNQIEEECKCILVNPKGVLRGKDTLEDITDVFNQKLKKTIKETENEGSNN